MSKKKVGLFFGTFNPFHIGHLAIANHIAEFSDVNEVWLVVTPHNPHKKKSSLLDNRHRYNMVFDATKDYPRLKPSDIEFNLPQPNYTVHTLAYLQEKFPAIEFALIMGEDNLKGLIKWKNYETILNNHSIYIYPRIAKGETDLIISKHPNIHKIKAPIMEISSTFIRDCIKKGKNVRPLLPQTVWQHIDKMLFYI